MSEEWDQDPECFLISFSQGVSCRFIKYKARKGYFMVQSGSSLLVLCLAPAVTLFQKRLKQLIILQCILDCKIKPVRHQLQAFCHFFAITLLDWRAEHSVWAFPHPGKEFACCSQTTSWSFFSFWTRSFARKSSWGIWIWVFLGCYWVLSYRNLQVMLISSKSTILCAKPGLVFPTCTTLYLSAILLLHDRVL